MREDFILLNMTILILLFNCLPLIQVILNLWSNAALSNKTFYDVGNVLCLHYLIMFAPRYI